MAERLDKRLVLNEWMFSQLGYDDTSTGMKQLTHILRDQPVGWDEQNVFHFRRALQEKLPGARALTDDMLLEYDRNIFDHWQAITRKRCVKEHRDIFPLYFQYMALVFTEYFLDRWSRDKQQDEQDLLDELNVFRRGFNTRLRDSDKVKKYTPQDLTKLAFWIATGGGKTLIMHCNIRQLDFYLRKRNLQKHFNKYILITPNEGLTDQHLEEFELSGISAERYQKDNTGLLNRAVIEVIEITKLKEKTGVTTVAVSEFGHNNVVMVDEGHRGVGGEEWFRKRQELCSEGFSFEYSATFGQSVNALSGKKQKEMSQLYAKGVLFDYSYKFFYKDGYGKDFHILNYSQENEAAGDEIQTLYLTGCLLRFYQQCRLYKDKHGAYASYLVDDPLMVFVGGSVTGRRQQQHDTDVCLALNFFADFIADRNRSVHYLDLLLRAQDELVDEQGRAFRDSFNYVQGLFPATDGDSASKLYEDILDVVFNTTGSGLLHAVYLKGSGNEIGLQIGDAGEYFGVINVGEPKKLWDMLQEEHGEHIVCIEQEFSVSLFDEIKTPGSQIRLLIGAKKFTEGWNCWRVSSMGLVRVGRNEGSQIIQLFGRGVRLKGLDFCLKRSAALHDMEHPPFIHELECLNVFGIRADYMKIFNDYIEEEDVKSAANVEIIHLPTVENLARTDLKVVVPKRDAPKFKEKARPVFGRNDKMKTKVSSDWYGRIDSKSSRLRLHADGDEHLNCTTLKPVNLKFLDYDRLYLELLHYKKHNAMYNLEISPGTIGELLKETDWYDLFIPDHLLKFTDFDRVQLWQEIASDLLKKYCDKFYRYEADQFQAPYQEYRTIQEILDDPDENNRQFLKNLRIEYQAAIEKSEDQLIEDLQDLSGKLRAGELAEYSFATMEVFNFCKHLYQPLIHVGDGNLKVTISPVHLNKHEKQFVDDLKVWCDLDPDGVLESRELYVLRNQSRGKGISFFEEGNFYPDFIIWLIDGDMQYITFADPHGLRHATSFSDSKVQFGKRIKQIEAERLKDPNVVLNSFILSPTHFSSVKHWRPGATKELFAEYNILFMYDDPETYITCLFDTVLGAAAV